MTTRTTRYDEDGEGIPFEAVTDTDVLLLMAEEVRQCNEAKGWYDTNPNVAKFMNWFEETFTLSPSSFQDHVHEAVQQRVEELFGSRTFGDDIALLHSEVSEMLEAYRDHGTEDATKYIAVGRGDRGEDLQLVNPKPEGAGSEAADVLVRLLDTCARYDIDLFAEWRRKVDFNWTRPARHGAKRL